MRVTPIQEDQYYHVYNRGNQKQILFRNNRDFVRFLFLLLYFQSPVVIEKGTRQIDYFLKKGTFRVPESVLNEVVSTRYVSVMCFCLMPNHFHLMIHNHTSNGLSKYMHRISNAYGKYFNTKYDKSGHVFQGAYKAVQIFDENQLTYLSAYIHRNPKELTAWTGNERQYPWSSYQDFCDRNRWGDLLQTATILERFKEMKEYEEFVTESGAKENFRDD